MGRAMLLKNGLEGVRIFLRSIDERNPYHLVFIDAQLPSHDAASMLATMRFMQRQHNIFISKIIIAIPPNSPRLPILRDDDRWDGLLIKPYTEMEVVKMLHECSLVSDSAKIFSE